MKCTKALLDVCCSSLKPIVVIQCVCVCVCICFIVCPPRPTADLTKPEDAIPAVKLLRVTACPW